MKKNSIIIPVYKNEKNIPDLISTLEHINIQIAKTLEVVFVVDGSPDKSYAELLNRLPDANFESQLILLSRNFGAWEAIKAGLEESIGEKMAVMAADLQEPYQLILDFFNILEKENIDVVIGVRSHRNDPFWSRLFSNLFWGFYKKFIINEMPKGGVDVFACNRMFCKEILSIKESNSSLIAQIFWLGCRRKEVIYERQERQHGKSAWSFRKKFKYALDSIFAFTDLPVRLLIIIGFIGIIFFTFLGVITFFSKIIGKIDVPGYATLFLSIGFLGAINIFGMGIIGSYVWRAYENSKIRPSSVKLIKKKFNFE